MTNKYRIRLTSRRIIGPYLLSDIQNFFKSKKLNGDEFYQYYPDGDWKKIESFPEILEAKNLLLKVKSESDSTIIKMTLTNDDDSFVEFKYKKDGDDDDDHKDKNEARDLLKNKDSTVTNHEILNNQGSDLKQTPALKEESNVEKTKIINIKNLKSFDKTQINTNLQELLKNKNVQDEQQEEQDKEKISLKKENKDEVESFKEIITYEDKTQVLNLSKLLPELKKEIASTENKEKDFLKDDEFNNEDDLGSDTLVNITLKKKGMKPIVAFCFLVIIYFVMFDEDKKLPLKPIFINIQTPIVKNIFNEVKSKELFILGKKLLKKGSYPNIVRAYSKFRQSVEYKYKNNKAFGYLVYSGSQIFLESRQKKSSAKVIFELLQMQDSLKIKDEMYVVGASRFFRKLKKAKTSQYYLDNYLRIKKKLTPLILNEYIKVLILNGDFATVARFIKNLKTIKKPTVDGYLNLAKFNYINENYRSEKKYIRKALKYYPKSTKLYLYLLDIFKRNNEFKKIDKILSLIRKLKAENRPTYFAKFYEYLGYHYTSKKKIKKATFFFRKSLNIIDSQNLRTRLASLDVDSKQAQKNLILESKVVKMIAKINEYIKNKKWLNAFTLSIDAVELYPGYIPSNLQLAKIQIKRGYFSEALKIIKDLKENYPGNVSIYFTYIDTFIESGKLTEANIEINLLGNKRKVSQTWQYASYLAKYYIKSNNFILSLHWLSESLKRNPLNSNDYFKMAEIYFKNNRFKNSKYNLNKALFLEPTNISFLILYAKILNELEGVDTAIGYLRHHLKKSPNNIEILSNIAIFYYQAGKLKSFNEMKKSIEELRSTDPKFYRFLIDSARLSDNYGQLIKYAYKLADEVPSDINNKLMLGQYLYIEKRFGEARKVFSDILDRLPSYPRVHYFLSKIFLASSNLKDALSEAKLEIKYNPNIYYGYFVAGETYRRLEQYGNAIKNLEKALSIDRSIVETLKTLGWIRLKQNFLNPALEFYLMAKRIEPNEPSIHKNLALIYEKIGQRKLAAQEYSIYLKLAPNASDSNFVRGIIRSLETN